MSFPVLFDNTVNIKQSSRVHNTNKGKLGVNKVERLTKGELTPSNNDPQNKCDVKEGNIILGYHPRLTRSATKAHEAPHVNFKKVSPKKEVKISIPKSTISRIINETPDVEMDDKQEKFRALAELASTIYENKFL